MVLLHRANMESAPLPGAILTAPGPTVADVKAELARKDKDPNQRDRARHVVDEAKDAFRNEAGEIAEHATLSLHPVGKRLAVTVTRNAPKDVEVAGDQGQVARRDVRVRPLYRTRSARGTEEENDDHARVIVLRNRRRKSKMGGSDPPS